MTTSKLKEKIKIVGFWTFGGIFWYLVVAFFLKSEYPILDFKFNLKDAYDVVKDALTLAAAFLAPVAAFILFNDWREQHVEKRRELDSEMIINRINILLERLAQLYVSVCRDENINNEAASLEIVKQEFLISLECAALEKIIKNSFGESKNTEKFHNKAKEVIADIKRVGQGLKDDEDFFQKYPLLVKNIDRFSNNPETYLNRLENQRKSIWNLNDEISVLSEEAKKLRI